METLTASGKPRVIDYRRNSDGEVQPVLGQSGFESDGDRADLWAGALRTAVNMPSRKKLDEWGVQPTHLGEQVRELLALWWNTPTKAEAGVDCSFGVRARRGRHGDAPACHPLQLGRAVETNVVYEGLASGL